jgi:uncharacterized protein (DUF1800 family)
LSVPCVLLKSEDIVRHTPQTVERPAPTEDEFSELVRARFEKTRNALDEKVGFSFMEVARKAAYAKYLAAASAEAQAKVLEAAGHEGLMDRLWVLLRK